MKISVENLLEKPSTIVADLDEKGQMNLSIKANHLIATYLINELIGAVVLDESLSEDSAIVLLNTVETKINKLKTTIKGDNKHDSNPT